MGGARLDRAAAERILRRAVELSDEPGIHDDTFDVESLLSAAADLGLSDPAVQQALAEEQAGVLATEDRGWDRLVGPAFVSAARVVPRPVQDTMGLLDLWLRRAWAFRRLRGSDAVAEYRRRTDVVAAMQRSARSLTGRENAEKVRRMRVVARSVGGDHSLVAIVVDLQDSRTIAEVGAGAIGASGTLMSVVSAFAWAPWAWLGIPASAAAGVGVMGLRRSWIRGIDTELEGVLDLVSSGQSPETVIGGITGRLFRPPGSTPRAP